MRRAIPLAILVFSMLLLSKTAIVAHAETTTTGSSSNDCSVCDNCPLEYVIRGDITEAVKHITGLLDCARCLWCTMVSMLEGIKNFFVTLKDAIVSAAYTIWDIVTLPFKLMYEGIMSLGSAIKNAILSFVNGVKDVLTAIGVGVSNGVGTLKDYLVSAGSWIKDNIWVLFMLAAGIIAIRYAIMG